MRNLDTQILGLVFGLVYEGFSTQHIIVLDKIESNVIISFSQKLVHTNDVCASAQTSVKICSLCLLHSCEALHVGHFIEFLWSFACRSFHSIFVKLCTKHGGNNCSCIFKNTWTRKKVMSHFLLELRRYLRLTLCSFKEDTRILKQGDERICKGIDIKAKSKSFKIILHLHQCMVMDR